MLLEQPELWFITLLPMGAILIAMVIIAIFDKGPY